MLPSWHQHCIWVSVFLMTAPREAKSAVFDQDRSKKNTNRAEKRRCCKHRHRTPSRRHIGRSIGPPYGRACCCRYSTLADIEGLGNGWHACSCTDTWSTPLACMCGSTEERCRCQVDTNGRARATRAAAHLCRRLMGPSSSCLPVTSLWPDRSEVAGLSHLVFVCRQRRR